MSCSSNPSVMWLEMLLSWVSLTGMIQQHPLWLGILVVALSLIYAGALFTDYSTCHWFSIVLVLLYAGGLLLLFVYVSSLSPRELVTGPTLVSVILMTIIFISVSSPNKSMSSGSESLLALGLQWELAWKWLLFLLGLLFMALLLITQLISFFKGALRNCN